MPSITSISSTARSLARAGTSVSTTVLAWLVGLLTAAFALARSGLARGRDAVADPVARLRGPLRVGLFGRRVDVSLLAALVAPVLALATAWWVGSTVGFGTVADWFVGTWTGRSPHLAVFLAAGALVALGAVSAAVNSGLVPTLLLVAGPLFGVGVTRYGRGATYYPTTEVVSLPEAVLGGLAVAAAFGVPLAVAGFCLGVCGRRVTDVLRGDSGPAARAGEA
ncbi:hypothetical protein [Halorarius halobius]|uniref:hypothetical protein n=1 Tax=Halorarius halobius TaxID=2962671 RepID=UPI0020CEE665|nr:hypothetical protein [Halorarius halobius]